MVDLINFQNLRYQDMNLLFRRKKNTSNDPSCRSFEPGPARRVDPGLEPIRVEEKTGERKTRCDPAG
jgi:hypothetical protein